MIYSEKVIQRYYKSTSKFEYKTSVERKTIDGKIRQQAARNINCFQPKVQIRYLIPITKKEWIELTEVHHVK